MDNTEFNTKTPIETALEQEIKRARSEGFENSAKCLTIALKMLKQAEKSEYDEWRFSQGVSWV